MAYEKRLKAVRDAYWENSDESDFSGLHDVIVDTLDIDPTQSQMKAVFDKLPARIIGSIVCCGMRDTVIRDEIYEFIENNEQTIRNALV